MLNTGIARSSLTNERHYIRGFDSAVDAKKGGPMVRRSFNNDNRVLLQVSNALELPWLFLWRSLIR